MLQQRFSSIFRKCRMTKSAMVQQVFAYLLPSSCGKQRSWSPRKYILKPSSRVIALRVRQHFVLWRSLPWTMGVFWSIRFLLLTHSISRRQEGRGKVQGGFVQHCPYNPFIEGLVPRQGLLRKPGRRCRPKAEGMSPEVLRDRLHLLRHIHSALPISSTYK